MRQHSDMPVIFLTSKDDEIDELFGLKMGADDFISKPFSQRLLVERVKAVLRRAQQRDGSVTAPEPSRAIERGKLVDGSRPPFLHLGRPGRDADGHRIPDPAVAGPAPRDRQEPRRPDGRGL